MKSIESRMTNFLCAMACAILAMGIGSAALARPVYRGTIPGSACEALDGKQAVDLSKDNGRVTNTASTSRQVVCPFQVTALNEFDSIEFMLTIEDNSTAETVSCTLHVRGLMDGVETQKKNLVLDYPLNNANHRGPAFTGVSWGNYLYMGALYNAAFSMWCRLPAASSVVSIGWMAYDTASP